MRPKVLLGLLALLVAGCVAEAFSGGGSRGKPCRHGDRRCKNGAAASPLYALQVFWGGTDAGQVGSGAVTTASGQPVTVTRASGTLCGDTSGGFSNQVASNVACTELQGLAIRPSTTNILPHTQTWEDWTQDTATFTTGQACPDGQNSGVLMTDTTSNGGHRVYRGLSGAAGKYTESIYAKLGPNSTSGQLSLWVGGNSEQVIFDIGTNTVSTSVAGYYQGIDPTSIIAVNVEPAALGFHRYSFSTSDVTNSGFFQIHMGKTYTEATGTYIGGDAGIVLCDPMTTNAASGIMDTRPFVINDAGVGTFTTRAADLVSVANPLIGGTFVLGISPLADNGRWDTYRTRGLIALGWDAGLDSDTATWFISDGGFQTATVVDHAGGVKTVVSNTISWPGRHYLQFIADGAGGMSLLQDGKTLSSTASGGGTGIITTQPSKVFIGSQGATTGSELGGVAQDICADPTTTGCAIAYTKPLGYPKKTLISLGDSLTNNTLNVNYWPARIHQDMPSWTTTNLGIPTWKVAQIQMTYVDAGLPQAQYISIEDGINDEATQVYTDAVLEFWHKQLWDTMAAGPGSPTPLIIRESPFAYSISWSAGSQTHYDAFQTWVASEAALYGYPYRDFYTAPGGMVDAGGTYAILNCTIDYDTDGVTNVCNTPGLANLVHYTDAGSYIKEQYILDGGWFTP